MNINMINEYLDNVYIEDDNISIYDYKKEKYVENISEYILSVLDYLELTPESARHGNCDMLAWELWERIGGNVCESYAHSHFFLKYKNRYYDSTHIRGVDDYNMLF